MEAEMEIKSAGSQIYYAWGCFGQNRLASPFAVATHSVGLRYHWVLAESGEGPIRAASLE